MGKRTCNPLAENLKLSAECGGKMSGVGVIYFVPRDKVTRINWELPVAPASYEEWVTMEAATGGTPTHAIELSTGAKFSKLEIRLGMANLDYTVQGEAGGQSWHAALTIDRNGFKRNTLGLQSMLLNNDVLIVAKMNNGDYHLLGDMYHGCEYDTNTAAVSGKAVTDASTNTFSFVWDANCPQIFGDQFDPENGPGINGLDVAE